MLPPLFFHYTPFPSLSQSGIHPICPVIFPHMIQPDIKTRLLHKKKVDKDTNCWLWQGEKNREGYGKITFNGKKRLVHRLSAMLFHGYDLNSYETAGLQINHTCKHRNCYNPSHLTIGTHRDNMEDVRNTPKSKKIPFPKRSRHVRKV